MINEDCVALLREATGAKTWVDAAALIDRVGGPSRLLTAPASAFAGLPGLGTASSRRVVAAIALGAMLARGQPPDEGVLVCSADSAFRLFQPMFSGLDHEQFHALLLDRRRRLLGYRVLTRGSDRFTVVDPPQLFRAALAVGAAAVLVAHNHPSGDPTPSSQDRDVTRRLAEAGAVIGIDLLDHLVLAGDRYVSLAASGAVAGWRPVAAAWTAEATPHHDSAM